MTISYRTLIYSQFYHKELKSAIIDGPIQIYFSQIHEEVGFKIYFQLQKSIPKILQMAREHQKRGSRNLVVIIYPDAAGFENSFGMKKKEPCSSRLNEDSVLGLLSEHFDHQWPVIENKIQEILLSWEFETIDSNMQCEINLLSAHLYSDFTQ